ncbi:MAG: TIGR02300 family protein [Parvularculaceae bacterium]
MTKLGLGVKRDCPECGARFYDLNKEPAHCPKCDNEFIPEPLLKPRKPRREDEAPEAPEAPAKPTGEVSMSDAEKEQKAPQSNKKPGLDDEAGEDEDLDDIEIDIDIDDDDDDTLLEEDEDDDDDMGGIIGGGDEDEV